MKSGGATEGLQTTKLYLIVEREGEYSDRTETPRWAYRDAETAQALMADLEKIAAIGKPQNFMIVVASEKLMARRDAYKALLGPRAEGVSDRADWQLTEIELVEP